jgi:hypothetical protein
MNFLFPLLGEGKALTASLPYFLEDYIWRSWDRTTIAMFTTRFLVCCHAGERRPSRFVSCGGWFAECKVEFTSEATESAPLSLWLLSDSADLMDRRPCGVTVDNAPAITGLSWPIRDRTPPGMETLEHSKGVTVLCTCQNHQINSKRRISFIMVFFHMFIMFRGRLPTTNRRSRSPPLRLSPCYARLGYPILCCLLCPKIPMSIQAFCLKRRRLLMSSILAPTQCAE